MAAGVGIKRYAQAVFQIALERNELDAWLTELRAIAATMSDPQLLSVLGNPRIRLEQKRQLIDQAVPEVSQLARNLVYLLSARGRLAIIGALAQEYQRLVDAHRGIEHAEVVTAVALEEGDLKRLTSRLSSLLGKEVVVSARVEPDIIGGLIARIGDRLLDGSTRSQLVALKKILSTVSR